MNASSPAVTMPGAIIGNSTLNKVCVGVAPSMKAASSSSIGISRTKLVRIQIVNGSVNSM